MVKQNKKQNDNESTTPQKPAAGRAAPEVAAQHFAGGRHMAEYLCSIRKPPPAKCQKARAFSARAFCPAAGFRGVVTRCVDPV
ncbi:MAG: hypothetical protein IJW07_05125 [Lentisphaeria bacterium]|nr:hypothetical protein [Lentisphaeria bacterium]